MITETEAGPLEESDLDAGADADEAGTDEEDGVIDAEVVDDADDDVVDSGTDSDSDTDTDGDPAEEKGK